MKPALRDRLVLPVLLPIGILLVIVAVLYGLSRILLSLTPTAATFTALVVAIGIVAAGSFAAASKQVRISTLGAMVGAVAGVAMLAGGIERLLADASLSARLAARAFEDVKAYSWDRRAQGIEELLLTLQESPGSGWSAR